MLHLFTSQQRYTGVNESIVGILSIQEKKKKDHNPGKCICLIAWLPHFPVKDSNTLTKPFLLQCATIKQTYLPLHLHNYGCLINHSKHINVATNLHCCFGSHFWLLEMPDGNAFGNTPYSSAVLIVPISRTLPALPFPACLFHQVSSLPGHPTGQCPNLLGHYSALLSSGLMWLFHGEEP